MDDLDMIVLLENAFPHDMAERPSGLASCTPTATTIDGEPWTMISNGKGAFAVPGKHTDEEHSHAGKAFAVRADASRHVVHLNTLRTWLCAVRRIADDPVRPGMFFGIYVDRGLIGAVLRGAVDENVTVYTHGTREPVVFYGEGWRGVVMPLEPIAAFAEEVSP